MVNQQFNDNQKQQSFRKKKDHEEDDYSLKGKKTDKETVIQKRRIDTYSETKEEKSFFEWMEIRQRDEMAIETLSE